MSKYTKREIDEKLGIDDSFTREKKRKIIRDLFRKWNARTNLYHSTQEELKEAQIMLNYCGAGMELYKSKKSHKRKYKKIIAIPPSNDTEFNRIYQSALKSKKKILTPQTKRKKKVVKEASNSGCLIPIAISLSSFGLLIWMLIF